MKPEIEKVITELMQLDKDFEKNLLLLLELRKKSPFLYSMAINKLRSL